MQLPEQLQAIVNEQERRKENAELADLWRKLETNALSVDIWMADGQISLTLANDPQRLRAAVSLLSL